MDLSDAFSSSSSGGGSSGGISDSSSGESSGNFIESSGDSDSDSSDSGLNYAIDIDGDDEFDDEDEDDGDSYIPLFLREPYRVASYEIFGSAEDVLNAVTQGRTALRRCEGIRMAYTDSSMFIDGEVIIVYIILYTL